MFPMLPQLHLSEVKKQAEAEGLDKIFIEAMTRSHQALRSLETGDIVVLMQCGHNATVKIVKTRYYGAIIYPHVGSCRCATPHMA